MRESSFIRYLSQHIKQAGGLPIKIVGNPYQPSGLPDLLVFSRAGVCGIEAKIWRFNTPPAKPLQLLTLKQKAVCDMLAKYIPIYVAVKTATKQVCIYAYPDMTDIGLTTLLQLIKGDDKNAID